MKDIHDTEIQPYLINRWLAMNDNVRKVSHWLDRYVFALPPKMWLALAWSVLPKTKKAPFVKYIKQSVEDKEFEYLYPKIRKQFNISDNDWVIIQPYLYRAIKEDTANWFSYYGVPKPYWKRYRLDYELMKQFNRDEGKPKQKGLEAWGL